MFVYMNLVCTIKKNLDFRYNKEFGTVGTFFGREVNKKQGHRKIE